MSTAISSLEVKEDFPSGPSTDRTNRKSGKKYYRWITFLCINIGIGASILNWIRNDDLWTTIMAMPWGKPLSLLCLVSLLITLGEMLWRIILVARYNPVNCVSDDNLLTCTVIVPAFNEGSLVMATLKSIAASDYPLKKLQIIAVDDGSQDDTWYWIKKANQDLNGRLLTIRLPKNQGKRHALYSGFQKSAGDVLVTVDSDSIVNTDTLRNLTSPFAVDRAVGGIAGNVRVLNCHQGIIPRMLDIIFTFSFDFLRCSQSMVKTVMCTPGALSAYRRDIVMTVVKEWLDQTFMGRPATIGEDRAMTNLILRAGYDVLFQKNALVFTEVPTAYKMLCKMFLRWNRSNIRESITMTRFAFTSFRRDCLLGSRLNLLLSLRSFFLVPFFIFATWCLILWQPIHFGTNVVISIAIFSSIPAGFYGWKNNSFSAFWAYAYGFFWFVALFWIIPYSMITPSRSAWLTRQFKPRPRSRKEAWGPPLDQHHTVDFLSINPEGSREAAFTMSAEGGYLSKSGSILP